jgi:2-amino-4-hydroxy-6-hydroxymethyldihydropteridine diphosphokinase
MVYYINIGSNLGNRLMNLTRAVSAIEKRFGWFELSHHIESEPWGFNSKNKFLNVGMAFISDLQPLEVLHILQEVEASINPSSHRNADGSYKDRVIDIDIMAVDGVEMSTPELTLPHPHLEGRPFFLEPYNELKNIINASNIINNNL